MSATRTAPSPPGVAEVPAPPAARRLRPPRWLDLRLVLGVVLVLGSVLLGARVVAAADATVPVWSAAGDLAAGTVLAPEDLVAVEVRLDDAAGAYLGTGVRPAGRALVRAVRAGELLPRSALEEAAGQVQLALPVQAGFVPPGLVRGRVVDVYAVADPASSAARPDEPPITPVLRAAPVQSVSGRSEGVLATAATTVQVVVSVPAARAPEVLAAIGGRPLVVVVHDTVDVASPGGDGPSTRPPAAPTTAPDPAVPAPTDPPATGGAAPAPDPAPQTPPAPDPAPQTPPAPEPAPGGTGTTPGGPTAPAEQVP